MQRRELMMLLAGAAAAWPLSAGAQRSNGMRRIGMLHDYADGDPEGQAQFAAFREELRTLGWIEGETVQLDYRSAAVGADLAGKYADELIALGPDVVVAAGGTLVAAVQRASRNVVPIVFVNVTDPVGGGLVDSLARPGGNTTGFTQFEFGISAKWLELLKQIAPDIARVAVIRDPTARSGGGQLGAIQAVAPSLGVELKPMEPRDADTIERDLTAFARDRKGGGLIVTTTRLARLHRELIISLAARYRLPAIYAFQVYVIGGGLISYGPDAIDPYRRSAGYVDRILKGEKPADLPVQSPVKYQIAINLATAKALGLKVPPMLLASADQVIE
jgi:putative ABC transport system substrate-binding protein